MNEVDDAAAIDHRVPLTSDWRNEEGDAAAIDLRLTESDEGVRIGLLLGAVHRIGPPGKKTESATGTATVDYLREEVHPIENPGGQRVARLGGVYHPIGEDTREMVRPCAGDVAGLGLPSSSETVVLKGVVRGVLSVTVLADDVAVAGHPYAV